MIALNPTDTRTVTIDEVTYMAIEDLSNERISFATADQIAIGFAQPCMMTDQIDVYLTNGAGDVLARGSEDLPSDDESDEEADTRLLAFILALKTSNTFI